MSLAHPFSGFHILDKYSKDESGECCIERRQPKEKPEDR
jgi:hypothetical protein